MNVLHFGLLKKLSKTKMSTVGVGFFISIFASFLIISKETTKKLEKRVE